MEILKKAFSPACLLIGMLFFSCSSDEDVSKEASDNKREYAEYAFSFNTLDISNLKEGESIQVALTPEFVSGNISKEDAYEKFYKVKTRSSIIPMVGTVTDLGDKKVNFKSNSGENLVPSYFTGSRQLTICRVWKISMKIDLPDESVSVRGFNGEFTGWKLQYSGNTQERAQILGGTGSSPEFSTYVYKLISDIYGVNIGRDLYLPIKPEEARIYVKYYYD